MHDDFTRCYRAVQSRDARFDGWFVIAVSSTGVYCRPSCPARTPLPANVSFHPSAAAAQRAGYRACKRCRPDASPGSPEWDVRTDVAARAMRLIADGVVDRDGVTGLAARLGYTVRQVERVLGSELGAGPLALARAQRAQTARTLIERTDLSLSDVAFAAGFASIRQFNDTIRSVFACPPTQLRRGRGARRARPAPEAGAVVLRLPARRPFSYDGAFAHLAATAAPGCEEVRGGAFRRSLRLPHGIGFVGLTPQEDHVRAVLHLADFRDLPVATARCRRLLDLDADPAAMSETLSADPALRPLVARAPGRRIPRTVDEHELAIRVVLGQQVSTAAARTLTTRLVTAYGRPVTDPGGGLTHLFPTAGELRDAELPGIPRARRDTLRTLSRALDDGGLVLDPGSDLPQARAALAALPGIGPWTTEVIAMRGLGDPDAFPAADAGVRTAAEQLGVRVADQHLRWRPWRSYATQYLWSVLNHPINHWPPKEPQ